MSLRPHIKKPYQCWDRRQLVSSSDIHTGTLEASSQPYYLPALSPQACPLTSLSLLHHWLSADDMGTYHFPSTGTWQVLSFQQMLWLPQDKASQCIFCFLNTLHICTLPRTSFPIWRTPTQSLRPNSNPHCITVPEPWPLVWPISVPSHHSHALGTHCGTQFPVS